MEPRPDPEAGHRRRHPRRVHRRRRPGGSQAPHQLHPRGGPGLPARQRAAASRRVPGAHRSGDQEGRRNPGQDRGSAGVLQHHRLQPAVARVVDVQRVHVHSAQAVSQREGAALEARGILRSLNRALSAQVPEATAFAFSPPAIPGFGNAGGFSMWLQDRSGGSVEFLDQNVKAFLDAARKRPELTGVNSVFTAGIPQVYADVDRDKVLNQGIAIGDVYQTMQTYLGGLFVNQFNRFGRQWRVFLQAEGESRLSEQDIGQYYVRNGQGSMVPLSTLVSTRRIAGPEYTNRFNLYRAAQVLGSAAPGYSSGQALAALEQVAAQVLPREMGYGFADLSYQEKKASGTAGPIFALSLGFVFLILAALYESWSLPFSVLLSVPVAVLGAFLGLYLRNFDLGIFAQIGLAMLIGLAAKNAILIVEFARDEMKKGRPLVEAALEGARLRLRPILMTSFAFIFGMAPLWIATGAGAIARKILGTVVITGMLAAPAIAIFIIPVLFVLVERLANRRGHEQPAPLPPEPEATP